MTYPGHARAILVLGLPLIGGHLGQTAIGATDTVMSGWYSVEALAAVTLGSTYFFGWFLLGSGFAFAVMPMVASLAAAGDETGVRRATRMGMWLSMGYGIACLPFMIWSEPILRALGQGEVLSAEAAGYLRVAAIGVIPALLVMVLKSYLAALERTQVVFWITVIAAIANGLANYALIFGNWGAPEMGVRGAAMASVITQIVSLIGVVIYVQAVLPQQTLFRRVWKADPGMMAQVFRLGWPIGLTTISEYGLFAASAIMMGWLGTIALAAHGIAVQLASITFMVHLGLSNVATIRAGNAFGRQDQPHMARGARVVLLMSLAAATLTVGVFLTWPTELISLFMEADEPRRDAILGIGVGLLALAALFQLVDGTQAIALGLLRGVQDTRAPLVIAALSYWAVGVPCSYIFGFVLGWDGIGVWLGLVVGLTMAAVLLNARFWMVSVRQVGRGHA